jgi:hypothetical protein
MSAVAAYSTDGRWLCTHDTYDLWLIQAGGGKSVRLTSHFFPEAHPAWGDNETLYYVKSESPQQDGANSRLMRLRIDPGSGHPVGDPEPVSFFQWSQMLHPKVVNGGQKLMFFEQTVFSWIHTASYPGGDDVRGRIGRGDSPQLSPDGSEVYYIDRTPGREGIYAQPTRGGVAPRRVASARGIIDGGFHLSPDGSMLTVEHYVEEKGVIVEVVAAQGGEPRIVYRFAKAPLDVQDLSLTPRWSPNGDLIVLSSPDRRLLLIHGASGQVEREIELSGFNRSPEWSPTGEHIACILYDRVRGNDVNYRVEVYSVKTGAWRELVSGKQFHDYIETIQWHPDPNRQQLNFFVEHQQEHGHWSVFLNRDEIEVLLPERTEAIHDFWGVWAPDGAAFYFGSEAHGEPPRGIHVYRESTKLVEHEALPDSLPFWSRDGATIGWTEKESRYDLKVIDLE